MTTLNCRRPGGVRVLVGLLACLILTLAPAIHWHQPTRQDPGAKTDWSCALCAASSAAEPTGSEPGEAPSDAEWVLPPQDSPSLSRAGEAGHHDRAPPAPLV